MHVYAYLVLEMGNFLIAMQNINLNIKCFVIVNILSDANVN